MDTIFNFGERVDGYDVRVLNEREVRASAGILFFLAMISFMNAWPAGNFGPTRIFVAGFLIDFAIRVLINPRYAPSLILGRFMVRNQVPEYAGAAQKRFAWSIGLALSVAMLFLVVINRVIGPINLIICSTCLLLLFFESAFGICLACKVYNLFHQVKASLCPGGACEVGAARKGTGVDGTQAIVLMAFVLVMAYVTKFLLAFAPASAPPVNAPIASTATTETPTAADDCKAPDWAVSIGHAEQWKLHHNCK